MKTRCSYGRAPEALAWLVVVLSALPSLSIAASEGATVSISQLQLVRERVVGQPLGMTGIEIVPDALERLRDAERIVIADFPLPERRSVNLELHAVEVVRPDARFVRVDPDGTERVTAPPDMRFFRGRVVGVDESRVVLTAYDGTIAGRLSVHGESFGFGTRWPGTRDPDTTDVRVWNHAVEGPAPPVSCDADVIEREAPAYVPLDKGGDVGPDTVLDATIAIDATAQWFERFGSVEAAQAHILDLIHQTSAIYEAEVAVRLEVGYLRIFTAEPDPYDGSAGTLSLLGQLRNEWNANLSHVERALVQLFDIQEQGGAGRAFVNVLCDNAESPGSSLDYGLSRIHGNGNTWELRMVAHEIGHGFSSQHTHCYEPEIDRCASSTASSCYGGTPIASRGTIMSYCSQYDVTLHPRVRDEKIRPAAEAAAAMCLTAPAPPELPGAIAADGASSAALELDRTTTRAAGDHDIVSWGPPCNADEVGGQDFAIYHGSIGSWETVTPLTCSTGAETRWTGELPDGFFLVVPSTATHEGSYGRTGTGKERPVSAQACRPQSTAECS